MKLWLQPAASADLEASLDYIAQHSPSGAARLLGEFRRRLELLATQPYSGPPRDDIAAGLRCLVVEQYCCFYRVGTDELVVVRILHGKRDLSAETFDD
jgi:toxin ParE1/3/4